MCPLTDLDDETGYGDFLLTERWDHGARTVEFASPPPQRGRIAVELLEADLAMFVDEDGKVVRVLGIPYRIVGANATGEWVGVERIHES